MPTTTIRGRDKSVILWRKYTNKFHNETIFADGFFQTFLPHMLFEFLARNPIVDISDYDVNALHANYSVGMGIPSRGPSAYIWTITVSPAGGTPNQAIDEDSSTSWTSTPNITSGDTIDIDLGSNEVTMGALLYAGGSPPQYPSNMTVYGDTFSPPTTVIDSWTGAGSNYPAVFSWDRRTVRYLRFEANNSLAAQWDIQEIFVYEGESNNWSILNNTNSDWALSLGTISSWSNQVGPLNLGTDRLFDNLNKFIEVANESDLRWEWWVNLDDEITFQSRRGSDKSATISFSFGNHIKTLRWVRRTNNIIIRLKVLGGNWDESLGTDGIDSGWRGSTNVTTYGPYEKIHPPKEEYPTIASAQTFRDLIGLEAETPVEELEITIRDTYSPNDYEVGDDVNITVSEIGLNDTFRIKQKTVNVDGSGGETVTLILGESAKYRSYKDYVDRLAWMKKKIIETEFRLPTT